MGFSAAPGEEVEYDGVPEPVAAPREEPERAPEPAPEPEPVLVPEREREAVPA